MALRVGITGHRLNRLAPDGLDAVRAALWEALLTVDRVARSGNADMPSGGASPEVPVRLLSPLAEGADRIAVQVAPAGWALTAVLPMPRADYELDFADEIGADSASLDEFRSLLRDASLIVELPAIGGEHASRDAGRSRQYAMLGAYLVGEIDLLVAVWDGRPAEGSGGTAAVVAEALGRGVGVVWIDSERPLLASILDRLPEAGSRPVPARALDVEAVAKLLRVRGAGEAAGQPAASATAAETGSTPTTIAEAREVM